VTAPATAAARAFEPVNLGPLRLRNRVIRTATFEGMCPGGAPSDALIALHRDAAAGGVGMTTVAYCSVSADGRTYAHQMLMQPEIVPALRRLTDAVHAEGAAASIQLGHCGFFASRGVIAGRPIGPSRVFNTYGLSFCRAMDAGDIARVTGDFGRATRLAIEAGFDAVELHVGHGYLLSQFLSPATNHRRDGYGGSLDGRLRLVREVVAEVAKAAAGKVCVLAKMNLEDGFAGGLELAEAIEVGRALEAAGVDALVPSGGFVSRTPLYMLRGEVPTRDMVAVQPFWWQKLGLALFGRLFVQRYPYSPLFFREGASALKAAVGVPVVLLGGIRSLADIETAMDAGFDAVAMGRALIREPDLINRYRAALARDARCTPCNRCIAEMDRGGLRCALDAAN
jgi:2,4-dienoyl-CoA reductase-like NADH-dependent reductase (Old Yellow Enzyme family)